MKPNEYIELNEVKDLRLAIDGVQDLLLKKDIAFLRKVQTSLRGVPFIGTWSIYDLDREAFGYHLMIDLELVDTYDHPERWCIELCSFRKTISLFNCEVEEGWAEFEGWIKRVKESG